MHFPSISVVLPTCDRTSFLSQAVDSVLAQLAPVTELLIIDDGHEDCAAPLGSRLSSRARPTVHILPGPRRGPGAARNVGIRAARGELIAFLDDDDLWFPEKLAWQVGWFARRPSLGLLGTDFVRTKHPRPFEQGPHHRPARLRLISRAALGRANRLMMSSVVVRKQCFEQCGCFDESLPLAQDWEMWLRLAERWEVGIVRAVLTIYRLHDEQRSANKAAMRTCETEVLQRQMRPADPRPRRLKAVAKRRLAWARYRLALLRARQGDPHAATEELRQALALFPSQPLIWSWLLRCAVARLSPAEAQQR